MSDSPSASAEDLIAEMKRKRLLLPASELDRSTCLVSSGLPVLDRICGGGLPRGRLSELVTGPCGGASVVQSVLTAACRRGELTALVDPADGFDALSARRAGLDLRRLLWVRPPDLLEALRAAELVLETGGFGVLALDLAEAPGRPRRPTPASSAAWVRLDRLARRTDTLVVVSSFAGVVRSFAALTVEIRRCRPRWRPLAGPDGQGEYGSFWMDGLELSFSLRRRRHG